MGFLPSDPILCSPTPVVQSSAFAKAMVQVGRPLLVVRRTDGRPPLNVMRHRRVPLRVGLISRADVTRSEVRRVAQMGNLHVLVLNAESARGGHGLALQTPTCVAEIDLSPPEHALTARLKQKWRNRAVRGARSGLQIVEHALDPQRGHWLLAKDAEQAQQRGYANWPENLTRGYAYGNPGQARIYEARLAGKAVAAMMFLCHDGAVTYHIGWSGVDGRRLSAHHALMWRAMRDFAGRGFQRMDLGVIATDHAPGLARFKLGTGAAIRRLGGTFAAVPWLMR